VVVGCQCNENDKSNPVVGMTGGFLCRLKSHSSTVVVNASIFLSSTTTRLVYHHYYLQKHQQHQHQQTTATTSNNSRVQKDTMPPSQKINNATWGITFLGRDEKTWGKDGIGPVAIDPNVCSATTGECPYYRDTKYDAKNDKIHLVIASFRDRLCPRTVFNIFSRAQNPHRIYVRILQQLKPDSDLIDDADCWDMACETYNNNNNHVLLNGQPFQCQDFQNNVEMVTIDRYVFLVLTFYLLRTFVCLLICLFAYLFVCGWVGGCAETKMSLPISFMHTSNNQHTFSLNDYKFILLLPPPKQL